jgi:hypothetical protein
MTALPPPFRQSHRQLWVDSSPSFTLQAVASLPSPASTTDIGFRLSLTSAFAELNVRSRQEPTLGATNPNNCSQSEEVTRGIQANKRDGPRPTRPSRLLAYGTDTGDEFVLGRRCFERTFRIQKYFYHLALAALTCVGHH